MKGRLPAPPWRDGSDHHHPGHPLGRWDAEVWLEQHGDCSYEPCNELRDAIDYAEQRRAQG